MSKASKAPGQPHPAQLALQWGALPDCLHSIEAVKHQLAHWQRRGWLHSLDMAVVEVLCAVAQRQQLELHPVVVMLAALCSHQLGRGHVCLPLQRLYSEPDALLAMPPEHDSAGPLVQPPSVVFEGLTLNDWTEPLQHSDLVGASKPHGLLVLHQGSLYMRRMWECEQRTAARLVELMAQQVPLPPQPQQQLQVLFPQSIATDPADQPDWQQVACALSAGAGFSVITGGPGTGKTTTVLRLLALLQQSSSQAASSLRVALAAPTGKAAARLSESLALGLAQLPQHLVAHIPTRVHTLHRLLGASRAGDSFAHTPQNPLLADVVVVDEASMIDLELFDALLQALKPGARLVLLGDKDQLASVEAGAVLGDLCQGALQGGYSESTLAYLEALQLPQVRAWQVQYGKSSSNPLLQHTTLLRVSRRFNQHSGIGRLAHAVNQGDTAQVFALLDAQLPDVQSLSLAQAETDLPGALEQAVLGHSAHHWHRYFEALGTCPTAMPNHNPTPAHTEWALSVLQHLAQVQVLTPLRRGPWGVEGLNATLTQLLQRKGLIKPDGDWYVGRPVLVNQNDHSLGLMNGDVGCVVDVAPPGQAQDLRVVFKRADGGVQWVRPSRLNHVQTAWAITVHKSQGSEFNHAVLVMPPANNPVLNRELVYTAITRAKQCFTVVLPSRQVLAHSVQKEATRVGGLQQAVLQMWPQ